MSYTHKIRHLGLTLALAAIGGGAIIASGGGGLEPAAANEKSEQYVADLSPLNSHVTGPVEGQARFKLKGDELRAMLVARGLDPSIVHIQHIHGGASCPDMSDDTNGDGFVDVIEGLPDYGPILVNLDSTLSVFGSTHHSGTFDEATPGGTVSYKAMTSLAGLEAELGEDLNLGTRHVVVHGVDPSTMLPDTVQSLGDIPAHLTLPVACGEISAK